MLKASFLCLWLLVAAQALGFSGLASALFTLTFPLILGLWLRAVTEKITPDNRLVILLILLSGLSVCVNALVTGTLVTPSYCKKLILFWCTLLLLGFAGEYRPSPSEVRFLFRGNCFLSLFLTGMFLLRNPQMHLLNGRVTPYLTFRFTNPNLAAVFLASMSMIQGIRAAASTGWRKRFHSLLGLVLFGFVLLTQARNALLMLLVFGTGALFPRRHCPSRAGTALAVLLPLLFALGYLALVSTDLAQNIFSFLVREGKGLDSRVAIWRFALEAFAASPLFGAYSQISGGTGASQMHNTHLDLLASYGLPVFILTCILLYRLLSRGTEGRGPSRLGRLGLFCLLLSGLGEAILFSGGMGVCLFAGMLVLLSNFDFPKGEVL